MRHSFIGLTGLLIVCFAVSSFAVTATDEVKTNGSASITVSFTKDEYDLFTLDKGDPKEWIRNACNVNMQDHTQRIKADLTKDIIPTDIDFKAKVKALQAEKLANEAKIR